MAGLERNLIELLRADIPEVRRVVLELATKLSQGDTKSLPALLREASETARQESVAIEDRAYALRVLALGRAETSRPVLERFLAPQHPEPMRIAAVGALGSHPDARVGEILVAPWRTYTREVRDAVLEVLFEDGTSWSALLDAIESGKVQPWSLSAGQRHRLLRSTDSAVRSRADTLFGESRRKERRAIYESYLPALRLEGEPGRGKRVFDGICSECHQVGDQGFAVGPDLHTVASRNGEHLLRDILLPNESIGSGFEEYLIETADGRSITGLIATQTPTTLVLRRANGEEDTVLRSSIAEMRSLSVSSMP